jgi:calcineurin-like phosphoesterase family protein
MTKSFFTSDWHFGHKNIIKYCDRPFKTIIEHDKTLLDNLNSTVGKNDHLYFLGDGFFRNPQIYLDEIRCENIFYILGSHDKMVLKFQDRFKFMGHKLFISLNKKELYLAHHAHIVWPKSHYGSIHLYGHSHGNLGKRDESDYQKAVQTVLAHSKSMDVGVDTFSFKPYCLEDIFEKIL